jgi:TRAP-type mannitol/chloroaromatic compound transport system permease small subunit
VVNKLSRFIQVIDSFIEWTGKLTAWLVLALVLLVCYDVAMRYFFHQGSIALQELEWHLFALIFLLGAAYTLKHDEHVRVDVLLNSRFISERQRHWVNLLGGLFLLLPFCILILITSWPFVENAYLYQESSPDPGGLPYRFILKASILVAFVLLILQGTANILRHALSLKGEQ